VTNMELGAFIPLIQGPGALASGHAKDVAKLRTELQETVARYQGNPSLGVSYSETNSGGETIFILKMGNSRQLRGAYYEAPYGRVRCDISGAEGVDESVLRVEWTRIGDRAVALLKLCGQGRDLQKELESRQRR
jgi:hypothetical protein